MEIFILLFCRSAALSGSFYEPCETTVGISEEEHSDAAFGLG